MEKKTWAEPGISVLDIGKDTEYIYITGSNPDGGTYEKWGEPAGPTYS